MLLPPAVDAERRIFNSPRSGRLSYYVDKQGAGRPLVLIHSINAAPSAFEVKPLFDYYRGKRPVYALDLPGFGFSDRSERPYTVELYVDAILDFLRSEVGEAADVVALSLACEFASFAAYARPDLVSSLALISPTGFGFSRNPGRNDVADFQAVGKRLHKFVTFPLWSQAIFDLLTSKPSIRYYLGQSFVGEPPQNFFDYAYATAHQPGARHAPLYFLSGQLFTADVLTAVYAKVTRPVLLIYDRDPNVSFGRLPELLALNECWQAVQLTPSMGVPHWEMLPETTAVLQQFWAKA
ncbi:MAG: alpha/beta fold hydrolase [Chloroflexi bacterium]|nr:alpha/beta fold hydrolase [Chloroflexota bacterium]